MNDIMPRQNDLAELTGIARLLAASGYFDAKGSSEMAIAQVATKIMAGREMGLGPFAAVQGIHVSQVSIPHMGCMPYGLSTVIR